MDSIDLKLITLLQKNARTPLKILANQVFLSSPATAARIEKLEKEGNAIIVAPDSIEGMKTLTTSHEAFDMLYKKGYNDGAVIKSFVSGN